MEYRPDSIAELAISLLKSPRSSHELIEVISELVIADGRFNAWFAGRKADLGLPKDVLTMVERYDALVDDVTAAGERFNATEWPRGEPLVWRRERDDFLATLCRCFERLNELGREYGRANQTALRRGPKRQGDEGERE